MAAFGTTRTAFLLALPRGLCAHIAGYLFHRRQRLVHAHHPVDELQRLETAQSEAIAGLRDEEGRGQALAALVEVQSRRVTEVSQILERLSKEMSEALYQLDLSGPAAANDPGLCLAMGQLQEWHSNPKVALSWYRRATGAHKAAPTDPLLRTQLATAAYREARILCSMERHEEARRLIEFAIDLTPSDPKLYNLGWLNLSMWDRPSHAAAQRTVDFLDRVLRQEYLVEARVADLHQTLMTASGEFRQMQEASAVRGVPGILLNTIARSASTYILRRMSQGLGIPSCQIDAMTAPRRLVPATVERLTAGGAVCRTHLPAETQIFDDLRKNGLTKMIFHVRDPRDACLSLIHQYTLYGAETGVDGAFHLASQGNGGMFSAALDERIELTIEHFVGGMCSRIQGWIDESKENGGDFDILFTTYDELRQDEDAFFGRILAFYDVDPPQFPYTVPPSRTRSENYRHGHQGHWRTIFSQAHQELMWSLIPASLADRFGWQK